jgi:hypothetical protein
MHFYSAELILFAQYRRPQARTARETADLQPPPHPTPSQPGVVIMPRLRGKSRRGAAWYRAESRRRRIQHFEKALTLASIRRKKSPWSPPMAIVEEISLEEAMQNHPPMAHPAERTRSMKHPWRNTVLQRRTSTHLASLWRKLHTAPPGNGGRTSVHRREHRKTPAQAQQSNRARGPRASGDR